jgi:adenylate cyclase
MREKPLVLVVDDDPDNREIVELRLRSQAYDVATAEDGLDGLEKARALKPDIIILDVMMPRMDGIETLKQLKADASLPFMPVIMLTAKGDLKNVVEGLDNGADDYLVKPLEQSALLARVRSMMRLKALNAKVQEQADLVASQAAELARLNDGLQACVIEQVAEIGRMQQLKRFLPPQLAQVILSQGDLKALEGNRREIVSLFCDMRGFTAFAETSEPEDVMAVLRQYHHTLGPIIQQSEGTIERFTGDGMLVFFNAPLPCPNPAERAVRLGVAMRSAVAGLTAEWAKRGHQIGFGVGIAQGYATCGLIGFEDRLDYAPIGTVTNVAARLCGHAQDGQVLVSQRVAATVEPLAETASLGEIEFKGLARPVTVFNISGLRG